MTRLISGIYEPGLEKTFQLNLSLILNDLLALNRDRKEERFSLHLEKNFQLDERKDYIDITIKHTNGEAEQYYLIELKFKKASDSAPDLGVIDSYVDMYNLDQQCSTKKEIIGGSFIFLTNSKTYANEPRRGTRSELPMHDGAIIQTNKKYSVSGKTAKKYCSKYPDGFIFSNEICVNYTNFKVESENYWYFMADFCFANAS